MGDVDWSQGLQGAAGGGMAGAAFGPWGAGIGAGLGFLGGAFGGSDDPNDKYRDALYKLSQGYGNRTAPQMGNAVQAGNSQLLGNRAGLIAQLEAQARGEGPSAAAIQMRDAMDRATSAQNSAAAGAGGRGVNAGAALRNASNQSAGLMMQGARDTAALRAQEQLNATNQLGGVIGQGINADNGLNMFNAGQMNDVARANMLAKLQMYGINDEATLRSLMGAMGGSRQPGMGTSIMAGGANAMPGLMQMGNMMRQGGGGGGDNVSITDDPAPGPGNIWNSGY